MYLDVSEAPTMLARALRLYEPGKHKALARMLRPGMTVVDVGACKGDFTVFAARRVGPAGMVIAVEPEPANARWLRRSIARNRVTNAVVWEMALSDRVGTATLNRADVSAATSVSSGWHSMTTQLAATRDRIEVNTCTLDELVAGGAIDRVDVVKLDVEGWEMAVLRGAVETLKRQRPTLALDVHPHLGVEPRDVAALLEELRFELFAMGSPPRPLVITERTSEILARPV